ncbi:nitrogen regulation protein NR(I) [Aliidiomarina sedimenti]|uniref:DNA-binding transcriptional regulator NtrC n=1 Tax=Aliidiomarina sedimenti TaxID=1933879 RepID=A0ABY0BY89_9GAMM|nr:nitrogen regulation protein NR(I) [Aliidiomarina sedimenti]RUO29216.1 nitrogen regulation protein NR(I) [Aliidiomarina sedimenti]
MSQQIWIVDDDESMRWVLERAFADNNWQVKMFAEADSMLAACEKSRRDGSGPDVVLTDVRMPGTDGMELLAQLKVSAPEVPVLVMTAHSDLDSAVSAFKGGAFEYLAKPFDLVEVLQVAERAVQKQQKPSQKRIQALAKDKVSEIIGEAPAMQEVFRAIGRLASSSISVLLTGASGTGKELVAHALHKHSSRSDQPFVALNMAAIPAELIESELFGHEKGAFTGALQKRSGRFQQANGGTLFLDEIGDMPLAVQTRLLRVLAEGQFYPVGSHQLVKVDVRIIAATHQDLRKAVQQGTFREDLYHRLNVIHIRLPTLSERREDIPTLARHFLKRAASELGTGPKNLTREAAIALQNAPWPGNVRQLENTCRWLTVMAPGDDIRLQDLPPDLDTDVQQEHTTDWQSALEQALSEAFDDGKEGAFQDFEQRFTTSAIKIALKSTGGHRQKAAKLLGWGRNTLSRKLNS